VLFNIGGKCIIQKPPQHCFRGDSIANNYPHLRTIDLGSSLPNQSDPRILFLTRRYPPSVGGIQTHCYHLYTRLSRQCKVNLVALTRGTKLHLLWFIPYAFFASLFELLFHKVDIIYFSDGVICVLAPILRLFTRAKFIVTIYGLEMTYSSAFFGSLMRWGIASCEKIAVISEKTQELTQEAGVQAEKIEIIYLGIEPATLTEPQHQETKKRFEQEQNISFGSSRILLNYGRMVPRKGVADFLEKGLPLLEEDIFLFISGEGPDASRIRSLCESLGLQERVRHLWLDDETLAMLRSEADLFLMPNVPYPGDVEGYGIAPLECMYQGTPVVAFAVDALVESIRKGGFLIPPNDYQAFVDQIHSYFELPDDQKRTLGKDATDYVRQEYSWDKAAEDYLNLFMGK